MCWWMESLLVWDCGILREWETDRVECRHCGDRGGWSRMEGKKIWVLPDGKGRLETGRCNLEGPTFDLLLLDDLILP